MKRRNSNAEKVLAYNVRRIRHEVGLSQEALADLAGLHRTYVSSVERGERNVGVANVFRLADALGVDPRELLQPLPKGVDG
jgi:transcriptional regulator with XRE-family HTH domain